jgi:cell division inhibitor SepF
MNEKLKEFLGIEKAPIPQDMVEEVDIDIDFIEDEEEEERRFSTFTKRRQQTEPEEKPVSQTSKRRVILAEPEMFNETPGICDQLKNGHTIVTNFEKMHSDDVKKSFYFLSGVVYTLNGSIQKIAKNVFVLAPSNIDIVSENEDELYSRDVTNWEYED